MMKRSSWAVVALLVAALSGCVTNTITNLTSTELPRNETGLYAIELAWDSNQQTMRDWTVTPYVVVGFESYEMRPTLGMNNRWEAFVPIPKDKDMLTYHFKVDYEYNRMGKPGRGSKLSRVYTLKVSEQ